LSSTIHNHEPTTTFAGQNSFTCNFFLVLHYYILLHVQFLSMVPKAIASHSFLRSIPSFHNSLCIKTGLKISDTHIADSPAYLAIPFQFCLSVFSAFCDLDQSWSPTLHQNVQNPSPSTHTTPRHHTYPFHWSTSPKSLTTKHHCEVDSRAI